MRTTGKSTRRTDGVALFTVERREIVGTVFEDYTSDQSPEGAGLEMILDYIRDNAGEDCSLSFTYMGNTTHISARYTHESTSEAI